MNSQRPHPGPLPSPTPREQGFRMPAEWEPHAATWLSWPHNKDSWPGKLDAAQRAYANMIAALLESEPVHINVDDDAMQQHAQRMLDQAGAGGEIIFHHFPTNDAWCRDHGAIFLVRSESPPTEETRLATDWRYNAWGDKYPPYDLDNEIPRQMADYLGVPRVAIPVVLEGGSIEVNGEGLLLTTESCLLNPNRNPQLSREQIEHTLREMLGVETIFWLGDGIAGDDTDGHIDDLTRFVGPFTLVTAVEENPKDENYAPLQENLRRLDELPQRVNHPLEIVHLPMPPALYHQGQRLPASYANFYIANRVVLLPTYNCPADEKAAEILSRLLPDRRIVGIDCTDLAWGLGACHCLTQQVPA